MGEISKQLHSTLRTMAGGSFLSKGGKGPRPPRESPDITKLIAEGFDPVYAVYLTIYDLASEFARNVSRLPEMRTYAREIKAARKRHLAEGTPVGSLSTSYFETWALFDHRIGKASDTLASCLIDANDLIGMSLDQLDAVRKLHESRMGVYEQEGQVEDFVTLRELITKREFVCHIPSGYRGSSGTLWFLRLLPPLLPAIATYHVGFTIPYILVGGSRSDWLQYLKRSLISVNGASEAESLHQFMKYGLHKNFWNDFISLAHRQSRSSAVFLAGIPDLRDTLPHA